MGNEAQARILGVRVDLLTKRELIELICTTAVAPEPGRVYNVNVNAMNIAARDSRFKDSLNRAEFVFCDGYGVKYGGRILGIRIPERLAVMDWIDDLLAELADRHLSVFLLGDTQPTVEACVRQIQERHPRISIAGTHHGFFKKTGAPNEDVCRLIRDSSTDVLMVGFGMPLQEYWIDENLFDLAVGVALPVGATFTWYAGVERRAPAWMADRGLEWAWRLAHHPIRLFHRYMIGNLAFLARLVKARLRGGSA